MRLVSDFIIKPIISEKSFKEAKENRYTFLVRRAATKVDIKNAVEKMFGVNVKGVHTAAIRGSKTRNTRFGRKIIDTTYKKARVVVAKDQKINIFEEKTDDKEEKKSKK